MRKLIFALIALNLIAFSAIFLISKISAPRANQINQAALDEEIIWQQIQEWRESKGLPRYIKSDELCRISRDRVKDGTDNHVGFHNRYDKYPYIISENISMTNINRGVLSGWLLSTSGHREALFAPYKYACLTTKGQVANMIFSNFE